MLIQSLIYKFVQHLTLHSLLRSKDSEELQQKYLHKFDIKYLKENAII